MSKHPIEYCTHTENPFSGCLHGCRWCYAHRFAKRLAAIGGTVYHSLALYGLDPFIPAVSVEQFTILDCRLRRARLPRRVFLGSMGDLGGDWDWQIVESLGAGAPLAARSAVRLRTRELALAHPRHCFLFLTKNPRGLTEIAWPGNAQIGTSVSTSNPVDRDRIRALMEVDAAVRWASVEPLRDPNFDAQWLRGLDWVVVGAQTGPGAPDPATVVDAAKQIVDWCDTLGIKCFVKANMRKVDPSFPWPCELVSHLEDSNG